MKSLLTHKIFAVIDVLVRRGRPMSVMELSRVSGIERNACWRIVSDLCEMGYLRKAGYRQVEPGMGMIYLGQSVFSEAFFPQRAINMVSATSRKLKVSAALAGIFGGQIVYLYREGGNLPSFLGNPLHCSNMAFCILFRKYGLERALQMLLDDVRKTETSEEAQEAKAAEFRERLLHLEKYGYALEKNGGRCNISFPVERNGEYFGLAFFDLKYPSEKLSDLVIRASLLRNELRRQPEEDGDEENHSQAESAARPE